MVTLMRDSVYDAEQSAKAGVDFYKPGLQKAYLFGFIRIPVRLGQWMMRVL